MTLSSLLHLCSLGRWATLDPIRRGTCSFDIKRESQDHGKKSHLVKYWMHSIELSIIRRSFKVSLPHMAQLQVEVNRHCLVKSDSILLAICCCIFCSSLQSASKKSKRAWLEESSVVPNLSHAMPPNLPSRGRVEPPYQHDHRSAKRDGQKWAPINQSKDGNLLGNMIFKPQNSRDTKVWDGHLHKVD